MTDKKIRSDRQWAAFLLEIDRKHKKNLRAKWKALAALNAFVAQHGEAAARIPSGHSNEIYFALHRCADRKNKWQVTEFDARGPYSDVRGNDYMVMAKKGIPLGSGASMRWPSPHWMDWRRAKPLAAKKYKPKDNPPKLIVTLRRGKKIKKVYV